MKIIKQNFAPGRKGHIGFKETEHRRKKYPEKNVTLAECELFTGRTHQIRVHLKSVGHTIVGDELYGKGSDEKRGIKRQFLHAYKVKFTHPVKKEEIELEIPLFNDMKEFLGEDILK